MFGSSGAFFGTNNGIYMYGEGPGVFKTILEEGKTTVEDSKQNPTPFAITGNHPNPFNPSTTIIYNVLDAGTVVLSIYDITGRKVCTLVSEKKNAEKYAILWNGRDDRGVQVASGIYFCRVRAGQRFAAYPMMLLNYCSGD